MTNRTGPKARLTAAWPLVRLAGATVILVGVVAQLAVTLGGAIGASTPHAAHLPTVIANFLSFFTIDSNVAALVVLTIAAVRAVRRGGDEPAWLTVLLACVSTYMIVTGIVYNTLLRGIELPQGSTVWWANELMHVVGPLLLLADLLFAPRPRPLPWRAIWIVVAFPVVWVAYTLLRANLVVSPRTGDPWWYPYPFLDPHLQGGYAGVALYVAGIAAAIAVIAWGVVAVGRRRAGQRSASSSSPG